MRDFGQTSPCSNIKVSVAVYKAGNEVTVSIRTLENQWSLRHRLSVTDMVCDTRHEHTRDRLDLSVAAYPCHHRLAVLAQDRRHFFFEVRIELRAVHPMIRQPRHDAAVVLPAAGRHLIAASVYLSARSLLALLEE